MSAGSAADFAECLRRGRLLEPEQLAELAGQSPAGTTEPRALAAELIRRGWLTPYQINQLFRGHADDLLLGSYVLLERLGAGGMGEVFKARNWKLGKVVALKLIRGERLTNPGAVRRFQREVRAAAQLNHPNVVHAYDCDEAGGKHFLVMEYVEGTDLARHVKEHGPLPVARACDWVRQAALGLQHAFERGMVHRDIKPHNLLVETAGAHAERVKILDLGLARLAPAAEGDSSSTMTEDGTVMGTLDYIAPEQALDAHSADIRSDLYSLGCTLYFLLAGQVPYPGGGAAEKLLKHQMGQPTPVEELRPDVPPAVAAIVRKLMARRPEDRYAAPAEAVADLAAALSHPDVIPASALPSVPPAASQAMQETSPSWSSLVDPPAPSASSDSGSRRRQAAARGRWELAATAGLALAGVLALSVFLLRDSRRPEPDPAPVAVEPPAAEERPELTFDEWLQQTARLAAEERLAAIIDRMKKHNPGFDGKVQSTIQNGVVVRLEFVSDWVTDLDPLRAVPGLTNLSCAGSEVGKGRLADLTPLRGMRLTVLVCDNTRVADLSPLKDMPLTELHCTHTRVTDLSPLRGMPLKKLLITGTRVADLSPLEGMKLNVLACAMNKEITDLSHLAGMPLTVLYCHGTDVADLSPLRGTRLLHLTCNNTRVTDLSPLKGMPLHLLVANVQPQRDAEVLRSLKSLRSINRQTPEQFWNRHGGVPKKP